VKSYNTPYAGDVQSATPEDSACITESVMSDVELLHNSSPSPCLSSINSRFENFSHVTSSESETDDDVTDNSLKKDLSMWATQFNVPQNAVDKLLKLLQKAGHHLPSTARGLLKTKRNVVVDVKSDLDYVYLGFDKELDKFLREQKDRGRPIPNHLELSLNIDGLPLFKSSNTSTWPVLCAVVSVQPICVFPVALACGSTKPKNLDFLTDTISNLNKLLQQGLTFDDCIITVSLICIVCDAPARSMVKAVKEISNKRKCLSTQNAFSDCEFSDGIIFLEITIVVIESHYCAHGIIKNQFFAGFLTNIAAMFCLLLRKTVRPSVHIRKPCKNGDTSAISLTLVCNPV
jgi:hypothetical protein